MRRNRLLPAAALIGVLAQMDTAAASLSGPPTNLPVYPGAAKLSFQMPKPMKWCGRQMIATVYKVKASSAAVERWYRSKISGATVVKISSLSPDGSTTGALIFVPRGSEGVTVSEESAEPGQTVIGLTAYDPPYNNGDAAMLRAVANGDHAAAATFKRLCSSDHD